MWVGCSCPPTHRVQQVLPDPFSRWAETQADVPLEAVFACLPAVPTAVQRAPSACPCARMSGIAAGEGILGPLTPVPYPRITVIFTGPFACRECQVKHWEKHERLVSWQPRGTEPSRRLQLLRANHPCLQPTRVSPQTSGSQSGLCKCPSLPGWWEDSRRKSC